MHNSDLITPQHLTRKAVIDIRQSTPRPASPPPIPWAAFCPRTRIHRREMGLSSLPDLPPWKVPLRITHPRKLAGEHRVIIVSGMLGQATPPTRDADADPLGQASAARTCLAASGHRHGIICLRLGQATKRIRR